MFAYLIFRTKRALLQFFCNFIPFTKLRIRARNAVYAKFIGDKIILLDELNRHLPKAVLTQLNAYDNEHFIKQNAQILPNFKETNANLRQNLPNSHKMTGGIAKLILLIKPKTHHTQSPLTAATLTLIQTPKTLNPHSILGLLCAFATRLSR